MEAIIDADGNAKVQYTYDAWGTILSISGPMADTLGAVNPLTYRGYVYDAETDLYYLQSRYYRPEVGRFLNADAFAATGQGFVGNNVFAYCLNNSVNLLDPAGTVCCAIFDDNNLIDPNLLAYFGSRGGSHPSGGVSTHGKSISIKEYRNTDDPEEVFENLEKYGMAYYNGVPVFQVSLPGKGGGASFGIIILDDYYIYDEIGVRALNHEYGHRLHMDDIGVINYTFTTATPSLLFAGLSCLGLVDNYFSLPWERIADMYADVNRGNYLPGSKEDAVVFWEFTMFISKLTGGV